MQKIKDNIFVKVVNRATMNSSIWDLGIKRDVQISILENIGELEGHKFKSKILELCSIIDFKESIIAVITIK